MKKLSVILFILTAAFISCEKMPDITPDMLDGELLFDPSIYDPQTYLVSEAITTPTIAQQNTPVIILAHGYSATTFEWDEFRTWNNGDNSILISQVLLGGHGRTYQDFREATWKDWRQGILDEYNALINKGYTNINFAGSSTGGALLLQLIGEGYFNNRIKPKNMFLIDPIVVPSNKILSIVDIAGPMLGYIESGNSPEEEGKWYHYRPYETLKELQNVINVVRKYLEGGIHLPEGTYLKLFKSKIDATADPVSAVMIYNGLKTNTDKSIDIEMINSDLHVFTRLDLRDKVSQQDLDNQQKAFQEMKDKLLGL